MNRTLRLGSAEHNRGDEFHKHGLVLPPTLASAFASLFSLASTCKSIHKSFKKLTLGALVKEKGMPCRDAGDSHQV